VTKGSIKTFPNITLANGHIGNGYSISWKVDFLLWHFYADMYVLKFRCISPYQLVDTGISNRIQTENQ
jgi:hypothetical protein